MEKYEKLLNEGLCLDHYYILVMLYNNQKLPTHKRIQGFANVLIKRGYLLEGNVLSDKALELIHEDILTDVTFSTTTTTTVNPKTLDFNDWVFDLHGRLQGKLVELTGKKQVRGRINGGNPQSFLCNPQDLGSNLKKIIAKYKIDDREAIEKALIAHIEGCFKANNWFPLIYYYIFKDGASKLVTDLESIGEKEETFNSDIVL
jgi:hypothetical protein